MTWWGNAIWGVHDWPALALMLASIWCLLVGGSVWAVLAASSRQQRVPAAGRHTHDGARTIERRARR